MQVIFAIPLVHEGTFDVWAALAVEIAHHKTGNAFAAFGFFFAREIESFKTVDVFTVIKACDLFPDRKHRFLIKFHTPDRFPVATSPVEIDPSILVFEKIGIPEGEGFTDFFKHIAQRILCPPDRGWLVSCGCTEIQIFAGLSYIRRIAVHIQVSVFMPAPVYKIIGIIKAG